MSEPFDARTADFSSLFQFLPIGAYRSSREGVMLRANPVLVDLNGYDDEQVMLADVNRAHSDWYVVPGRRAQFRSMLERDGFVRGFVSEVVRHSDRSRRWVSENAHGVFDASGQLLYYEGTVEDISERMRGQEALWRSEQMLRLLTEQIPGMAFVVHVSHEGRLSYRYVSEGSRDIYGLAPAALMADPQLIMRYSHPDDVPKLERDMEDLLGGRAELAGELRVVRADGEVRWVLRRSSKVSADADGQLRIGLLLDITDRKLAELALRDSEALWKLALDSAGDGVWDWNVQTGEEYLSPRILAMYGFGDDAAQRRPIDLDRLTHPDDVPQMLADRDAHFDGRAAVYRNEHRIRCQDGSWKWVLSRGMLIERDSQGRPLRMVGTHTDITDLKQAEAHQKALEGQLRESQKMEAIGTLAGGVAHDFNNLLAAILGNLTLAREDVGPDHVAQESLAEIHRAAIRARQLVQQILAFSRRQTQELQLLSMGPVVEEALRLMRSLLPAGVRLDVRLPDEVLPVLADATQLQQVLMNLCTNAWQAMGTAPGVITVTLDRIRPEGGPPLAPVPLGPGQHARLSVADNGPGMDEATRHRIFEPFFTTKAPGSGTGLGLAVVHGIVKAHQGSITVHSVPGQGSRFDVFLPLADAVPGRETAPPGPPPVAAPPGGGRHVVYVDDYEALVMLVGRTLRKQGHRVTTFGSAREALHWLGSAGEAVDLLVTDQNMPDMSGVELAQAVRLRCPTLRVAIVSGHVDEALREAAARAGVSEVLGKQDSMEALAEVLRQLLEAPRA